MPMPTSIREVEEALVAKRDAAKNAAENRALPSATRDRFAIREECYQEALDLFEEVQA